MQAPLSRRTFLRSTAGKVAAALAGTQLPFVTRLTRAAAADLDFPIVDFHVHLDNSSLEQVLPLAAEHKVKFGIVEHAGTKENKYPVVLSNDTELSAYLEKLKGQPVYKGVQAEWIDWMSCFSPEALAKLDYVLSDAMTFPGPNGQRIKLWEKGAQMGDPLTFMDRYVDWHVEVMAREPLDILANTSWLPDALLSQYDSLWTTPRIEKVVAAAVKYQVALEISSSYGLPKLNFLQIAKAGGVKFSFGSNGRYPKMGKLDYSVEMAKKLGLTSGDMFMPASAGQKPFQRRQS
jgi:histidinol phosphatase-like PHP family hydrolase